MAFTIAEVGNNHEGSLDTAKKLVEKAAEAKVDAVKFQTFKTENFVRQDDRKRFEQMKRFELPFEDFLELSKLTKSLGLKFISTPLDMESAEFLSEIVDVFKIASGDNNFFPLIDYVSKTKKPLIISTGLLGLSEVKSLESYLFKKGRTPEDLSFLHCVSGYPVPFDEANLRAITHLAKELQCPVGYSDHTIGIDCACFAAVLGASIIEKHFTLDHHFSEFRDHLLSANPAELRVMVEKIDLIEKVLGQENKELQAVENQNLKNLRRSIVAKKSLSSGVSVTSDNITWKRPWDGLPPGEEDKLIGRSFLKSFDQDESFRKEDLSDGQ